MKAKIVYVADFFYPESLGGAEQSDNELLNIIEADGIQVVKIRSNEVTEERVSQFKENFWIISNFMGLDNNIRLQIAEQLNYIVWEHDHKYLLKRDPSSYADYQAPQSDLVNVELYQNAQYVVVQSNLHNEIINKNLDGIKTYVVGGNLWSDSLLSILESQPPPSQNGIASIMVSGIAHKNAKGAIKYCQYKEINYELIPPMMPEVFFEAIARNEYFVFLPMAVETLSRIVVEAKMLGCKVLTNQKIGAASHDWFRELSGKELINYMKYDKKKEVREFMRQFYE